MQQMMMMQMLANQQAQNAAMISSAGVRQLSTFEMLPFTLAITFLFSRPAHIHAFVRNSRSTQLLKFLPRSSSAPHSIKLLRQKCAYLKLCADATV
jgi:hypothetical protein